MTAALPVGIVLIAVGDTQTGAVLREECEALGWSVVGPFTNNFQALQWLSLAPDSCNGPSAKAPLDLAVVDALMRDGASPWPCAGAA